MSVAPLACAKTAVGKVIISIGSSTAVQADGVVRPLKRRSDVFEGDVLKTGGMARLQVRFIDGQLIALKADTEFKIEEYKYKQGNKDTASMTLFKGGMRAITGAIGKVDKDDYKVKTPVASLGVRGTHYGLFYCPGNCGSDAQGNANKPGLYGGVVDGSIVLTNEAGSTQFDNDQYFTIASKATAPQMLFQPPSNVFGSDEPPPEEGSNAGEPLPAPDGEETTAAATEGEETATTTDGTSTTTPLFTTGDQTTIATTDGDFPTAAPAAPTSTTPAAPTLLTGTAAPGGAGLVVAGIPITSMGFDGGGDSIIQGMGGESFSIATVGMAANQFVNGTFVGMTTDTLNVYSDATLSEVGGNGTIGVNWGRWSGGKIEIIEGGTTETFTPGGFSFVYSPNVTTTSTLMGLTSLGMQTYSLSAGPSIRDAAGAVLSGTASFSVDFAMQFVADFNLSLSGNGRSYMASYTGTTSVTALQTGTELMLTGTCTGCTMGTSLTGNAGGLFVGPAAEGVIGYFGVKNTAGTDSAAGTGLFLR